jgi:hypothetical protein
MRGGKTGADAEGLLRLLNYHGQQHAVDAGMNQC